MAGLQLPHPRVVDAQLVLGGALAVAQALVEPVPEGLVGFRLHQALAQALQHQGQGDAVPQAAEARADAGALLLRAGAVVGLVFAAPGDGHPAAAEPAMQQARTADTSGAAAPGPTRAGCGPSSRTFDRRGVSDRCRAFTSSQRSWSTMRRSGTSDDLPLGSAGLSFGTRFSVIGFFVQVSRFQIRRPM